jgi:hypothetical protein
MPHANWTDVITNAELLRGLNSDPRTTVGNRLENISVIRHDSTGRAETIRIEGEQRHIVSGWDFKIIIGRSLGWNLIKSSRFKVSRSGLRYIFRGSGFGHGLGLCQEGGHVMAQRGADYRQVLAKYFPGTVVDRYERERSAADLLWVRDAAKIGAQPQARFAGNAIPGRRKISAENVRLDYPSTVNIEEAERLLKLIETRRADLVRRFSSARTNVHLSVISVYLNNTTGDFVGRTGQPSWAAAATKGTSIELQPLALLSRRRILETTIRHELVHALINSVTRQPAPRWLEEGLALYVAREGKMLLEYSTNIDRSPEQLNELFERARTPSEMARAYAAAYREVERLIRNEGELKVWLRALGHR